MVCPISGVKLLTHTFTTALPRMTVATMIHADADHYHHLRVEVVVTGFGTCASDSIDKFSLLFLLLPLCHCGCVKILPVMFYCLC